MDTNMKLLNITGMVPSKSVTSSVWKLVLYRMRHVVCFVLFMLATTAQLIAMYLHWGDIDLTTDNISIICFFQLGYLPALYQMLSAAKLTQLVRNIETDPFFTHSSTVDNARKLAYRLTCVTLCSTIVTSFFWTAYPLLARYLEHYDSNDQFKYLVFVMWLPCDISDPLCYAVIYVFQLVVFLTNMGYCTSILSLVVTLLIYVEARFRIVVESIKRDDVTAHCIQMHQSAIRAAVGEAVYCTSWYSRTTRYQRALIPILARAQNPVAVTVGGMFALSLPFFSQV
ncbi:hypothetical protein L9F63_015145, partial [Diploptera punctata]